MPVRENSSIPLCLGAWDRATTPLPKHTHPPGVNDAETSFFSCTRRMRLLVPPIPEGAASATTITNISLARHSYRFQHVVFSPHFRKGDEAMKGKRRTHTTYYCSWRV